MRDATRIDLASPACLASLLVDTKMDEKTGLKGARDTIQCSESGTSKSRQPKIRVWCGLEPITLTGSNHSTATWHAPTHYHTSPNPTASPTNTFHLPTSKRHEKPHFPFHKARHLILEPIAAHSQHEVVIRHHQQESSERAKVRQGKVEGR
jgi:hypothetical protein